MGATTLSITAFSITTLTVQGLFVTHNINDTKHNKTVINAECNNAERHVLFIVMRNVVV
jgi:hypothetical protein